MPKKNQPPSLPVHDYGEILTKHAQLAAMEISALIGAEVPITVVSIMTAHMSKDRAAQSFGLAGKVDIKDGEESNYLKGVLVNGLQNLQKNSPDVRRTEISHH